MTVAGAGTLVVPVYTMTSGALTLQTLLIAGTGVQQEPRNTSLASNLALSTMTVAGDGTYYVLPRTGTGSLVLGTLVIAGQGEFRITVDGIFSDSAFVSPFG